MTNQVSNSIIKDVKLINKTISSDGADPSSCQNLIFDDSFFRIPDDCISIKAISGSNKPNLDIMIKNCIFGQMQHIAYSSDQKVMGLPQKELP